MGVLTADQILAADDANNIEVQVDEWGGSVLLRPLTIEQRELVEKASRGDGATNNHTIALLVSLSLVNEDGSSMFKKEDVLKLKKKSARVVARLFNEASKLNGLDGSEGND